MVRKRISNLDKYFLLSGKRIFIIMIAWFVAVILHNLVYGLFKNYFDSHGGDEAFFFIIAIIVIPIYFIIGVFYSLVYIIKNKKYPKKKFYIKLIISGVFGLLITLILLAVDFLNSNGIYMSLIVFTFLIFGVISFFQKNKK